MPERASSTSEPVPSAHDAGSAMNAGVFPAGNPWKAPPLEAIELPVECEPEMGATTGRVLFLLLALLVGGFTVVAVVADRGQRDWVGDVAGIVTSIGFLAAAWAWPRLVRPITVMAEGLVDHRGRHATPEALPWSEVESITPVPGVADTVTVRFTGRRSIQPSGPQARRRAAIEAIYAITLPTLALRLVGETLR